MSSAATQTERALLALRESILNGDLPPGGRLSEQSAAERTGVSRTPVRAALVRLEEEGLVEAAGSGGFAVRRFSERDVHDAIELRGTLEGLAARFAAERGVQPARLANARALVAEIDGVIAAPRISDDAFSGYVALNARFHALLQDFADSPPLARQLDRVMVLPFASPSAFVLVQAHWDLTRTTLMIAQDQHRTVLDAIEAREGTRAEALMREHARLAQRNLKLALMHQTALHQLPGAGLLTNTAVDGRVKPGQDDVFQSV